MIHQMIYALIVTTDAGEITAIHLKTVLEHTS